MSETQLKLRLDKLLPPYNKLTGTGIHRQSMTYGTMSFAGTPDKYYDGTKQDLWIEWKCLRHMPRSGIVIGEYTQLQLDWMTRRLRAGSNIIGVVGLPNKLVCPQFHPGQWEKGTPATGAIQMRELASWVIDFCGS